MCSSLSSSALACGQELWEQARQAFDASQLGELKAWAAQAKCAEAERMLAKAHLRVALNRLSEWATAEATTLVSATPEKRTELTVGMERRIVLQLYNALEAATRGACQHQSLQCFYLACLIAHAARARITLMQIMARQPLLQQLQALWAGWEAGRGSDQKPWGDPAAECVIGDRAPYELDGRPASVGPWMARVMQVAPARLAEAVQDDKAAMDHLTQHLRPLELKSLDMRQVKSDPAFPLTYRFALLTDIFHESERSRLRAALSSIEARVAGLGQAQGAARLDAHRVEQQVSQSMRIERLKREHERRRLEAAQQHKAAAAAALEQQQQQGPSGRHSSSASGGLLERPTQEDIRRFLQRKLLEATPAAMSDANNNSGKGPGKRGKNAAPAPADQQQQQQALMVGRRGAAAALDAAQAKAALQALAFVPLGELVQAAEEQEQQGALAPEALARIRALVAKLAGKESTKGAAPVSSSSSSSGDGGARLYRWPPSDWQQQQQQGKQSGKGKPSGGQPPPPTLAMAGGAAQYQRVLFEAHSSDSLTQYLESQQLARSQAAVDEAVEAVMGRLLALRPLLSAVPRTSQRLQQVLRGIGVAEPPFSLPKVEEINAKACTAQDLSFVKLALQGALGGQALLEAVRSCAPSVAPANEPLGGEVAGAGAAGNGNGNGKQQDARSSNNQLFRSGDDYHLKRHFTALDYHAFKAADLWMPVMEGAVSTTPFFPHCTDASFPMHVTQRGMKGHPGELYAETSLARTMLGVAMLRALRRRREGSGPCPHEAAINSLLRRDLLCSPDEMLTLLEADADALPVLRAILSEIISATSIGDGAAVGSTPDASDADALSSANRLLKDVGTGKPPVVQMAAAGVLAEALARQPHGTRIKLDWLNTERASLCGVVLAGVDALQRRQRLTRLAAQSMRDFILKALEEAEAAVLPSNPESLAACLCCIGGLPLMAAAQLCAYVAQLVGRSFLDLTDLCPHTFEDLAPSDDLPAERVGGGVQLSMRGVEELLPPTAALVISSSGGGGGASTLLQQGVQQLASYMTTGSIRSSSSGGAPGALLQRQRRKEGAAWPDLLAALQQQAALTAILADLRLWVEATEHVLQPAMADVERLLGDCAEVGQGVLADQEPDVVEEAYSRATHALQRCLHALALSGHTWSVVQLAYYRRTEELAQAGDDQLGRQTRGADVATGTLIAAARAQLRTFRSMQLGTASDLEKQVTKTAHLAELEGAHFLVQQLQGVQTPVQQFLNLRRYKPDGDDSSIAIETMRPLAAVAEHAFATLNRRIDSTLRDATGMVSQLDGLLDCCHLRTQLLLSELHARCRFHPASELMGMALRQVLPLKWQQEWRTMQESTRDSFLAELLLEEEMEQEKAQRRQQKAAKKKASKKGVNGSNAAAATSKGDEGSEASAPTTAAADMSADAAGGEGGPAAGPGVEQLPDSWEQLPQSSAEAAAVLQQSTPGMGGDVPESYLRMLQEYELCEQRQCEEEQQQQEAAAGDASKQRKKKKGEKKGKNKSGETGSSAAGPTEAVEGEEADGAQSSRSPSLAAGSQAETAAGWQPVGKKNPGGRSKQPGSPPPTPSPLPQPGKGSRPDSQQQQQQQQGRVSQSSAVSPHKQPRLRAEAASVAPLTAPSLPPPPQQHQQQQQLNGQQGRRQKLLQSPEELELVEPQRLRVQARPFSPPASSLPRSPQQPDLEPKRQAQGTPAAAQPLPLQPSGPLRTAAPAAAPAALGLAAAGSSEEELMYQVLGIGGADAAGRQGPGEQAALQQQPSLLGSLALPVGLSVSMGPPGSSAAAADSMLPMPPMSMAARPPLLQPLHRQVPASKDAAAAVLQQAAAATTSPELGLGSSIGSSLFSQRQPVKVQLDPETIASAARAAALAGYARHPMPPQIPIEPQVQPPPHQSSSLFLAAATDQLSSSSNSSSFTGLQPTDWREKLQPLPSSVALAGVGGGLPPGNGQQEEVDSYLQLMGLASADRNAQAPAGPWAATGSLQLNTGPPLGIPSTQQPFQQQQHTHGAAGSEFVVAGTQLQAGQAQQQVLPPVGAPTAAQRQSTVPLTGLCNDAGEYNCFLNVIVQCLWRCAEFREQVLGWNEQVVAGNPVARSLHRLFLALWQAQQQQVASSASGGAPVAVNPAELREALASLPNQLFQLGEMSDAGETLLSMFEQIQEVSPGVAATLKLLFGLTVQEAVVCPACRKTTHANRYTQYFYNTRASALRQVVVQAIEERRKGRMGPKTLGARLARIEEQVYKSCDTDQGGCNKSCKVTTRLEQAPLVFSLQIAWLTNHEAPKDIAATLAALDEVVDLGEVYQGAQAVVHRYRLRSMVCYYGRHYQALVLVPEAGGWLMFDDTRVSRVGDWAEVRRKCEAGRIQPSVLFYEFTHAA